MFHSARIKLTVWYVIISLVVSLIFSGIIFASVSAEVERFELIQRQRYERRLLEDFKPPINFGNRPIVLQPNPALILETKNRILILLLLLNGLVGIGALLTGYFLAGRTLKPIKTMIDQQTQFVSDASHELKTPLTALKTTLEVYLRGKKRNVQEADEVAQASLAEVEKLHQLSSSLLELTAAGNFKRNSLQQTVAVSDWLYTAVKQVTPLAKKRRISIKTQIKPATVIGDTDGLVRALVILLDNAIKYSPTSSQVQLISSIHKDRVMIKVQDHGIGIDVNEQSRIFDRFYRVDQARTKLRPDGYGLGLSIAEQIIRRHGGSISVESQIGQGSTFTINLPLTNE